MNCTDARPVVSGELPGAATIPLIVFLMLIATIVYLVSLPARIIAWSLAQRGEDGLPIVFTGHADELTELRERL